MAGGTLIVAGDASFNNFVLTGNLTGAANLTVNGQFIWNSGTMSSTGHTILNGASTLSQNATLFLTNRAIDNSGTATFNTTNPTPLVFSGNAVWNNLASGTLIIPNNLSFGISNLGPNAAINNAGTIRKTGSIGLLSSIPVTVNNTGLIDVQGGVLQLSNPNSSSSSGNFNTAANTTLVLGSSFTLNTGATGTGAGVVAAGSLTVAGDASLTNFVLNGTLTGPANLTINGQFIWNSGTMLGTGHTILNGNSTLSQNSTVLLADRIIDNSGTVTFNTSNPTPLVFGGNAVWNNLATGVLVLPQQPLLRHIKPRPQCRHQQRWDHP